MRLALLLLLVLAAPARAEDAVVGSREAAARIIAAAETLRAARSARDRLAAYADAVLAYEDGLSAMREGLRQIAARRATLETEAAARAERLGALVSVLQVLERGPAALRLAHPQGPVAAARAAHLLAGAAPELDAELLALKVILGEIARLEAETETARDTLRQGLAGLQGARAALARALAARRRPDPAPPLGLPGDAETLDALAASLAALDVAQADPPLSETPAPSGSLPLPVAGTLETGYRKPDAEGRRRPGLILAAQPGALVTAPMRATLRYAGHLRDHGEVAILEPRPGVLLVLAGLGRIDRMTGEILGAGEPVGLLGGLQAASEEFLIEETAAPRETRTETLYMEFRRDGEPVDPTPWFSFDR